MRISAAPTTPDNTPRTPIHEDFAGSSAPRIVVQATNKCLDFSRFIAIVVPVITAVTAVIFLGMAVRDNVRESTYHAILRDQEFIETNQTSQFVVDNIQDLTDKMVSASCAVGLTLLNSVQTIFTTYLNYRERPSFENPPKRRFVALNAAHVLFGMGAAIYTRQVLGYGGVGISQTFGILALLQKATIDVLMMRK